MFFPIFHKFLSSLSGIFPTKYSPQCTIETAIQPYLSPQTESGPVSTHVLKPLSTASSGTDCKLREYFFSFFKSFVAAAQKYFQLNTYRVAPQEQPYLSPQTESGPAPTHVWKPTSTARSGANPKLR
jgi:hypothetical protein